MIIKTWIDKSAWGEGEWQYEPDRIEWERYGLPCLMIRHSFFGCWRGYVAVLPSHQCYQKSCHEVDIEGQYEICFSDFCQDYDSDEAVCHQPKPGEPDNVWWFGFDCCHAWDVAPAMNFKNPFGTYRNVDYVKTEVENLAAQLALLSDDLR